jgi:hypothetical protein
MGKIKEFPDALQGVFCCGHVFRSERPVLLVAHDEDGDCQFFCGGEDHTDDDDVHHVCVGHLLDSDSTLNDVSDLPAGCEADRLSIEAGWVRTRSS